MIGGGGKEEGKENRALIYIMDESQFIIKYSKTIMGRFDEFLSKYRVKVGPKIYPLRLYMREHKITRDDIRPLYDELVTRTRYLRSYYTKSLKPSQQNISVVPMVPGNYNNNLMSQYKNVIRNMYFFDLFVNTDTSVANVVPFGIMLNDLYNKELIDYKILTPSALHYIAKGRLGSVFSSYYFRASIMNPFLVYSMQESELKGRCIFSPTLGWSSYCYGFMESESVTHYVGTDVIPSVCENTKKFAAEHYPRKVCDIYCCPSEELENDSKFMRKYTEFFDTVFFSPPYYDLEIYGSDRQSVVMHSTYERWLSNYWEKTVKLCKKLLKKKGTMCYIVSNYAKRPNLTGDMEKIVKNHFTLKRRDLMRNKAVYVNNKTNNSEKILIWEK